MAQTQAIQNRYIARKDDLEDGEPVIKGTRIAVRNIVTLWRQGVRPEEMPQHYPHITLAQVFDALSYFSDNTDEINLWIERNHIRKDELHPLVRDL